MDYFELQDFNKRIGLNTKLDNISKEICNIYNLGNFISNDLITIGYEDYNYILTSSQGKYCVKIFNKERNKKNLNNYLERIRIISDSDVKSPKPLKVNGNINYCLNYENNDYNICVFQYIDGKNFFELQTKANEEEIKELAKQTALINNLNFKPDFIYDSWAIINFENEYKNKRKYLSEEQKKYFDNILKKFKKIDINKLPKGFVHGDIISTNVMKDINNSLWIIDFAVSNYLPRIIDLAIIACNMCLIKDSEEKTIKNILLLLNEYNKYNNLTDYEFECFTTFYELANAMHIMCTSYISKTDGESEENNYWYNEGIVGLSYSNKIDVELFHKNT